MIHQFGEIRTQQDISGISIAVCSAQAVLTAGFRAIAGTFSDFRVVAEWDDFTAVRKYVGKVAPDVLLMETTADITLDALAEVKKLAPSTAVVLWVDGISLEFIYQALGNGVRGVLRKNCTVREYEQCMRQVATGELHIEQSVSMRLLRTRQITLAPRQRVLMGLVAQGLRNKEIAWQMGITEGTVKVYLSHLFDRLGVSDRMELALLALKNTVADQSSAADRAASVRAGKSDFCVPLRMSAEVPVHTS